MLILPSRTAARLQLTLHELLDQFVQRRKLLRLYKLELIDVVDEVLEARVQMSLCREQHYVLEVRVVDMRVHSEETLENHLNYVHKIARKRYSDRTGKHLFVVQLRLHPRH